MKIAELFVRLTVDQKGLKGGLTSAQKDLDRFGKTAGRVAGVLGAGLFTGMVKSTIDAQNEMAQLNAVLKSTGGAAGVTVEELDKMSRHLQSVTTFSDGAVKGAQALLLTFTQIRGAELHAATKATLNLAQAMGGDLKGAAIQVGKALNDPKLGLTALRKAGIQFSESQTAAIKKLVETGKMAEAQRIILAELEVQFGGSAEAARNTLGGALKALANAFDEALEASETSTTGIVGALNALTEAMPEIRSRMDRFIDGMVDQFRRFKRDIMALKLGEAWANAQLQFWSPEAAKDLENARKKFWGAQDAINPLTLPGVFVNAPEGSGKPPKKPKTPEELAAEAAAAAAAAKKVWDNLLGTMRDTLALQGAMKEAGMSTLSVDNQILAAYHRLNDAMARGVKLTNEQLAAAIRLKTELGAAMAPGGGNVGITPMAGRSPMAGIKVKGSNLFDTKDQWGNTIRGQFRTPGALPKERSFFDKAKSWAAGGGSNDSMGTKVGQVLQAGGGSSQMGQMVQAFAAFGPMAAVLPVINGAMEKLGPAFEKLITPLVELGAMIGEALVPVFEMLTPVVRLVVNTFGLLKPVLKALVWSFSWVMQGIGEFVKGLGIVIDALVPDWISKIGKGLKKQGQEMIDAAKSARKNTKATDDATAAVEKFAGSLSNIPRVLNVNALRHMVTGSGGMAPGGPRDTNPSIPVNVGTLNININGSGDPRRVAEEVGRVIERTGSRGGQSRLKLAMAY